jgi:hypothetical protein
MLENMKSQKKKKPWRLIIYFFAFNSIEGVLLLKKIIVSLIKTI